MSEDLSSVTIGPYAQGDEHAILAAFNKVFAQDRSLETWSRQFRDNPEGIHCYLAKLPSGRVLSQFTSVPRRTKVGEGTACFGEIVDSLTDPEFRQGLKKPGLFATTCYRFVDHYGKKDGEVIMYGLPNPPAYRVGRALLGYTPLYPIELLTRELTDTADGTAPTDLEARAVTSFPAEVDDLFARIARHHDVMTIRDRRYLAWRYAPRPDVAYEILELRDPAGALLGIACLRHRWLGQPVTACAELLFEAGDPRAPSAIAHVVAHARAAGSERVQVLFRPDSPEWQGLAALGWHRQPSQFRLVARTYDKDGLPMERLLSGWQISLGDFDIV